MTAIVGRRVSATASATPAHRSVEPAPGQDREESQYEADIAQVEVEENRCAEGGDAEGRQSDGPRDGHQRARQRQDRDVQHQPHQRAGRVAKPRQGHEYDRQRRRVEEQAVWARGETGRQASQPGMASRPPTGAERRCSRPRSRTPSQAPCRSTSGSRRQGRAGRQMSGQRPSGRPSDRTCRRLARGARPMARASRR